MLDRRGHLLERWIAGKALHPREGRIHWVDWPFESEAPQPVQHLAAEAAGILGGAHEGDGAGRKEPAKGERRYGAALAGYGIHRLYTAPFSWFSAPACVRP